MSAKHILSQTGFEDFIRYLVHVEEERNRIVDDYFPEPSERRDEFQQLMDQYIKKVDDFIRNEVNARTFHDKLPFVTIGSIVELENIISQQIERFRIVLPLCEKINMCKDVTDTPYISPIANELLLKKVGDIVTIPSSGEMFQYKIKHIQFGNDRLKE